MKEISVKCEGCGKEGILKVYSQSYLEPSEHIDEESFNALMKNLYPEEKFCPECIQKKGLT